MPKTFHVGTCPECGEEVKATQEELNEDWIECKNEDCGFCARSEQFQENSDEE